MYSPWNALDLHSEDSSQTLETIVAYRSAKNKRIYQIMAFFLLVAICFKFGLHQHEVKYTDSSNQTEQKKKHCLTRT